MLQQRFTRNGYHCLWHRIGKGFEAGTEARGKYHCFHIRTTDFQVCLSIIIYPLSELELGLPYH